MKRELDILCGENILKPNVVVGVFLVREGANIHAVNQRGLHPLSVHPPDVAQLVTGYTTINTKSVTLLITYTSKHKKCRYIYLYYICMHGMYV